MSDHEREEPARSDEVGAVTESEETVPVTTQERVFVGTGLFLGLFVGVILAVAVIVLAAQNTGAVTISFLVWDISTTLIVVLLGSLLIGIVLDELFGLVYRKRRRRTLRDRDELNRLR